MPPLLPFSVHYFDAVFDLVAPILLEGFVKDAALVIIKKGVPIEIQRQFPLLKAHRSSDPC